MELIKWILFIERKSMHLGEILLEYEVVNGRLRLVLFFFIGWDKVFMRWFFSYRRGGDDVTLSVQDSNSSCLIRQPGNADCTFVVMPMRL